MINKKGAWFLTLFSIILVLSVYYITMPTELLISDTSITKPTIKTEEDTLLVSLRVEEDEKNEKEIDSLKKIISNSDSSIEDKNAAFEKIKEISNNRSKEDVLEDKIKSDLNLDSFVKIDNEYISATVISKEKNNKLANDIMRLIQKEFKEDKKITIKFQENS